MTKTQQNYLSFLAAVERVLQQTKTDLPILSAGSDRVLPELERMQSTIRQRELLIPVVGAFSAGKSSLLNAIVEAELLPVAITPETAMPLSGKASRMAVSRPRWPGAAGHIGTSCRSSSTAMLLSRKRMILHP